MGRRFATLASLAVFGTAIVLGLGSSAAHAASGASAPVTAVLLVK